MTDYLSLLRDTAKHLGVSDIASIVLDDPRFPVWSASAHGNQHHYGDGGLLKHTNEVVTLCLVNRAALEQMGVPVPTERETFLAALWHDQAKLNDYAKVPQHGGPFAPSSWQGTPYKRLVHHISGSAIAWSRAVDKYPTYRDIEEAVLHAILAHHGSRQWGSPVAPKTRLAWLVHFADCMSARMNDADTLDVVKHYGA